MTASTGVSWEAFRSMAPQQQRSVARRNALIDSARRSILTAGATATTMVQVSSDAASSSGAIYRYFTDRVHLIAGVCDEDYQRLTDDFLQRLDQHRPQDESCVVESALRSMRTIKLSERSAVPLSLSFTLAAAPDRVDYIALFAANIASAVGRRTRTAPTQQRERQYILAISCVDAIMARSYASEDEWKQVFDAVVAIATTALSRTSPKPSAPAAGLNRVPAAL